MTRKLKFGLAAAGAVAVLTGGGATLYAQSGGLRGPMAKFDADSNGAVTLAEARSGAAAMFAEADSDRDGRITGDEMRAHHGKMAGPHRGAHKGGHGGHGGHGGKARGPMHLDADGDGAVTAAEIQGGIEAHFAKIDANRDGSIDAAELRAAHGAHHAGKP